MSERPEQIAQTIVHVGASVSVGSWAVSGIEWLNHNHLAVLALCGILGAVVSVAGLFASVWFMWRRDRRESEQKP